MKRPADPTDDAAFEASPARLDDAPGEAGETLRRASRDTHRQIDEDTAWLRFENRLTEAARPRGPAPIIAASALGVAAGMAIVLLAQGRPDQPLAARPATAPDLAVAQSSPVAPPVAPGGVPGARGDHDRGASALAMLPAGDGETSDAPQPAAPPRMAFESGPNHEVLVGPYRFAGDDFRVTHDAARVEMHVKRGRATVYRLDVRLATVVAGWRWSGRLDDGGAVPRGRRGGRDPGWRVTRDLAADPTASRRSVRVAAAREPASTVAGRAGLAKSLPDAVAVATPVSIPADAPAPTSPALAACAAQGRQAGAEGGEACYAKLAVGGGLEAEVALYEVGRGRLRRHDQIGAAQAFKDLRRRFPDGTLAPEAALSLVEIMPRLGRHDDALTLTSELLATGAGRGRAAELHLLRGNIYREAMTDCVRAEIEYAAAAQAGGRAGDEAAFLRGVCLEALGRSEEARAVYQRYADRPDARRRDEARRRLEALGR